MMRQKRVEDVTMDLWLECARDGLLLVRGVIDEARCDLIEQLLLLQNKSGDLWSTLRIDSIGGDAAIWRLAKVITRLNMNVTTIVDGHAYSAGLILSLAGDNRSCYLDSRFQFHGTPWKSGCSHVETEEDVLRSEWFAEQTGQDADFWLEKAASGKPWYFDAQTALEIGVVHEIADGGAA
jgi:ATP-dependent protease ClpP protease subunit